MDIGSGKGYPSSTLSNFSPNYFSFDGVDCYSMEGFLQSLKFNNVDMQRHVCTLVGRNAKFKGKDKRWWVKQELYWNGKTYPRLSEEYQELIDRAYLAMATQNERFRKALLATGEATLTHSMGKNNPRETILTEREFCGRLTRLRKMLKDGVI